MIWLFRTFRHVPFMDDAIAIWAEADVAIEELNELAGRLHRRVLADRSGTLPTSALVDGLETLNARLNGLEERFSLRMGQASRETRALIQQVTLLAALALAASAVLFSAALLRRQSRADQALRNSEERFRSLWETAPDAIVSFDAELRIRSANAAVRTVFGHDPAALVGQSLTMLQPTGSRNGGVGALWLQTRETSDAHRIESTGLHRDGREIALEVVFSRHDLDGTQTHVGFFRDVSARKQIEHALRISEERMRRTVEASGLSLWDLDADTGSVFLSEEWSVLLGGPREVTRTTLIELLDRVPDTEREAVLRAVSTALESPEGTYCIEHRVARFDGEWIWNLSEGRVVERDAAGGALRVIGTNRDITERKRADEARSRLEAQLRESQKMEAVGTLSAGIAHDFNNILGGILGHLALTREDLGSSHPSLSSLEQINKAALRARTLVQQILAFGRNQPLQLVSRCLQPLLRETLALMRSSLPAGVILDTRMTEAPVHALIDSTQIQQVLMNLCTNAWHALDGHNGRIVTGLDVVTLPSRGQHLPVGMPAGEYAHLWVSDTGCGMDPATQKRIFEPFFTTKRVGQGTGLGLSVVHGIVATHLGAISVDSRPGRGTTIHVVLPLAQAQDAPVASSWGGLDALQSRGDGQHVLYIDDDDVMLLLVERLLQRLGYRVTACQDPIQALAAVRADPQAFGLVISDFNMPGLNGLDVARELAQISPGLPVVISSGHLTDDQREALGTCGVRELIRKEYSLEELGAVTHRLLH